MVCLQNIVKALFTWYSHLKLYVHDENIIIIVSAVKVAEWTIEKTDYYESFLDDSFNLN